MHYLAEGYNAFVLIYSCNARHPAPLLNASYAILKLRQRCEEFGIDRTSSQYGEQVQEVTLPLAPQLCGRIRRYTRHSAASPRTSVPMRRYSATLLSAERQIPTSSFDVLLGKDATRDELSKLSIENRVTPKTPPIFLWCTANDDCVPAQNSLVMAKACVSNKVPVELHMFDCVLTDFRPATR